MIPGLAILFAFLLAGDAVSALARIPIPGSVLGMILLAAALKLGVLRLENLSFLFIPAGVGLMAHFELLRQSWLALLVAWLGSTFLVLAAVGRLQSRLDRSPAGTARP
jgi:holin-like protein